MRGLSVHIYRNDDFGDCTGSGVTSPARADGKIFVIFDEALDSGHYKLEECQDDPRFVCLRVVRRHFGSGEYLHVEPMFGNPEGRCGPMFGGNYVCCSDSRFGEISKYPLPVHDRFETWEDYDKLTR